MSNQFRKVGPALSRLGAPVSPAGGGGALGLRLVATASNLATSWPVIEAGDLILCFLGNTGSAYPTLPTGFTSIRTQDTSSGSIGRVIAGLKIADGSETTFPTGTANLNYYTFMIYRGAKGIGVHWGTGSGTNSDNINLSLNGVTPGSLFAFGTYAGMLRGAAQKSVTYPLQMALVPMNDTSISAPWSGAQAAFSITPADPALTTVATLLRFGAGSVPRALIGVEILAA